MDGLSFRDFKRGFVPELERAGVPRRDAHLAVALFGYIRWFDIHIFGARDIARIVIRHEPTKLLAECHLLTDGTWRYIVHAHAIVTRVRCDIEQTQFFLSRETGRFQFLPATVDCPTMKEFLIAVAAHEVRHRLQQAGAIPRMFSANLPKAPAERLLRFLWLIERVRYRIKLRSLIAEECDAQSIATEADVREFDARFIEQVVLHQAHACETEQELVDLVLLEPPEASERRA